MAPVLTANRRAALLTLGLLVLGGLALALGAARGQSQSSKTEPAKAEPAKKDAKAEPAQTFQVPDEKVAEAPFYKPPEDSVEMRYLREHPDVQYCVARVKFFLESGSSPPMGTTSPGSCVVNSSTDRSIVLLTHGASADWTWTGTSTCSSRAGTPSIAYPIIDPPM